MEEKMSKPGRFVLALMSYSRGKAHLKLKGQFNTVKAAEAEEKRLTEFFESHNLNVPYYRVMGKGEFDDAKAAELKKCKPLVRKKSTGPKNYILCPVCNAKSKKLYSEMGGLQTRKCKSGHYFEVDMFFGFETSKRQVAYPYWGI